VYLHLSRGSYDASDRPKEPPIGARPSRCQKPWWPESTNQSGSFGCVGRGARQAPAVVLSLQHVTIRPLRARRAVAPQLPSNGLRRAARHHPPAVSADRRRSPSADVRHVTIRRPHAHCAAAQRPPSNGRAKARCASSSTGLRADGFSMSKNWMPRFNSLSNAVRKQLSNCRMFLLLI